ncbi:MAG: Thioredoxin reductase [Mycoplasmataceae bacterium]|nr:MAG: Thioredoxin reductase [Mycoplasmataceae bacterium]
MLIKNINKTVYDLLIIGAGPAGISASIYAKRAMLKVLLIESEIVGGKLNKTGEIENYPGFKSIQGIELAKLMKEQLISFNFEIKNQKVESLIRKEKIFQIKTNKEIYLAKSIIVSTGTKERKLEIEGEIKFTNKGVSYCAVCDGFLFRNKEVVVVGGGYSGCESALYLSKIVKKVNLIHHSEELKIDSELKKSINDKENINVILNSKIIKINGTESLKSVSIINNESLEIEILASAVFPCIGMVPNSNIIDNFEIMDEWKYIQIDSDCETKIPGIFSAGDVTKKKNRQIVTAVSDGSIAAQSAIKYLQNLKI